MTTLGITAAQAATADIDELLRPAIDDLRSAINVTERSGVYRDIAAVRAALVRMKFAVDHAQRISRRVDWPISPERRRLIINSLSAGIAQREHRASLPETAGSNRHPAPPSDDEVSS